MAGRDVSGRPDRSHAPARTGWRSAPVTSGADIQIGDAHAPPRAGPARDHGNVVHAAGVRPLAFSWSPEHDVDVVPAPIASVAMLHRLSSQIEIGEGETIPVLAIDGALAARPGTRLV